MPWSTVRQLLIALIVGAVLLILGATAYFAFIYTPPSCTDGVQNQGEEGVDCGGACARVCVQPNISTLWSRSVSVARGVYHAVALIKNPDTSTRGTFPYTLSLFDAENILVATREGRFTILPGEIAPLFEANIITGERAPVRTFVDIGPGVFDRAERGSAPVRTLSFDVHNEAGTVAATIENQTLFPVEDVVVTALLYDDSGILMRASQTLVERLDARERRVVVFTWQEPFEEKPAEVDIIPRVVN